jgi:hypothetical protein
VGYYVIDGLQRLDQKSEETMKHANCQVTISIAVLIATPTFGQGQTWTVGERGNIPTSPRFILRGCASYDDWL